METVGVIDTKWTFDSLADWQVGRLFFVEVAPPFPDAVTCR